MENVVFEPAGLEMEIGHCKKCHGKEFGIDRQHGRVFVYCKSCGEEVLQCP